MTATTVQLPDLRHLISAEVEAEMTALDLAGDAHETGRISDAFAITVAAWWQAPSGPGETFTRLVSHLPVTVEDLRRTGLAHP